MSNRLVVERMTSKQLFERGKRLVWLAHPLRHNGPGELELLLDDLQCILEELETRREQLALFPEAQGRRQPGLSDVH